MLRFHNFDVVFAEFPDETTLAINLTGCPNRCAGCHSPHLQGDGGEPLDEDVLRQLLGRYGGAITCVGLMGGDGAPDEVAELAAAIRRLQPGLRVGWYSGRTAWPPHPERFDYIKLGPWLAERGPLTSPATNQRLYRVHGDGRREDITARFRRK